MNNTGSLSLMIPSSFDWSDFFSYIFNKNNFNIDNYIDTVSKTFTKSEKWLNEPIYNWNYYNTLKSIFTQLQK